ncbi:hypothetical protein PoB_000061900, partial [Plakobranchus ocellatus]
MGDHKKRTYLDVENIEKRVISEPQQSNISFIMHVLISTWMFLMASSVFVIGSPTSSFWRALADSQHASRLLERQSRSLLNNGMPCVTISYLN